MSSIRYVMALAGVLLLSIGPASAAETGCARYPQPEKQAKCKAAEQRAAKTAERKRIDAERKAERTCANPKDAKMRAECEKKGLTKAKP